MDTIIVLIVPVVAFFLLIRHLARSSGQAFSSSLTFTSQAVMHNFANEERKHAIEKVQYVQEDSVHEEEGGDPHPLQKPNH